MRWRRQSILYVRRAEPTCGTAPIYSSSWSAAETHLYSTITRALTMKIYILQKHAAFGSSCRVCIYTSGFGRQTCIHNKPIVRPILLGHIAKCIDIRPTATNVASSEIAVCLSVCIDHNREPCKNGWTDRNAVWAIDSCGPKESCISTFERMTPGFPHTLSSSVPIRRPLTQSGVAVNIPREKSARVMRPFVKILWPLVY